MRIVSMLFMASAVPAASRSVSRVLARPVPAAAIGRTPLRCRALRASAAAEAKVEEAAAEDHVVESEFLKRMQWRGFLQQTTDIKNLDGELKSGCVAAYLGFDATASSLHVGSLLQIMLLRHYQQCGHKPIVLVGGGTTKVGDPSGKDASRQLLTQEVIDGNIAGITQVFSKFLKFGDGPTDAVLINNDEWLSSLQYLDFLRDYGRHFTINRMLSFESVKQRLERESPLSFLEFNYMILQAEPAPQQRRDARTAPHSRGQIRTAPLHQRTTTSLHHRATAPRSTAPPHHRATTQSRHCATASRGRRTIFSSSSHA